MPSITVIGAGYAGLLALGRLRAQLPGARLVLVEPRSHFEERIRLYQVAAGAPPKTIALARLCERLDVTHVRARARAVEGRTTVLEDGRRIEADAVLLCAGSRTRPPPGPAHVLDDVETATALHSALRERPDARLTVIGGGATAIEASLWIAARFPDARVTVWRDRPTWGLSERANAGIDDRMRARGVFVRQGGRVIGLDAHQAWSAQQTQEHDIAVWCVGFEPCPVEVAGPRAPDGRIHTDAFLRIAEGVFAAGDAAVPPIPHRFGCVTAMPTGAHAAGNIARYLAGGRLDPFSFRDVLACVALDPGFGVAQSLDGDGPDARTLVGRLGGLVKAGILTYVSAIGPLERGLGLPVYRWPTAPPELPLETP